MDWINSATGTGVPTTKSVSIVAKDNQERARPLGADRRDARDLHVDRCRRADRGRRDDRVRLRHADADPGEAELRRVISEQSSVISSELKTEN